MSYPMTRQQKACYDFIAARMAETGISPSFDEMTAHLGLRSKSGTHRIIIALVERGKIVRLPNRARSIAIADDNLFLRLPVELNSQLAMMAEAHGLSVTDAATRAIAHWVAAVNGRAAA